MEDEILWPDNASPARTPGAPFLVRENVFRLCKPGFPLDIKMIIFS
jgi:hypothetical protein